jgi:hypothetical protein
LRKEGREGERGREREKERGVWGGKVMGDEGLCDVKTREGVILST